MSEQDHHARLIDSLAASLDPVVKLRSPARRTAGWLLLIALPALGLAAVANLYTTLVRYAAEAALSVVALGSVTTARAAAAAAILTTLPDRDPRWALLPLPSLTLWIGASVTGAKDKPGYGPPISLPAAGSCLTFIAGLGIPFALLLAAMLRQGYALRPELTAGLAGLAVCGRVDPRLVPPVRDGA